MVQRFESESIDTSFRGRATTYLVYNINEGLGIFSMELSHHVQPILFRKDGCDQRNTFSHIEGIADQPFPIWRVAAHEKAIMSVNARFSKRNGDSRAAQNSRHLRGFWTQAIVIIPAALCECP